jgi:hypothetical protein
MLWWERTEKISWTDIVKNVKVLHTDAEERNVLHEIKSRKANWICYFLRMICFLYALLKERHKEWKGEEDDIGSYWKTIRMR